MFEFKPLKKPVQQNKPAAKVASAFKNAMNDDDDAPSQANKPKISQFAASIPQTNYQKILEETSKIVLEDPSVYSYDEHYDDIRDKRKELEQVKKQQATGSKYIANLKKASEKRKVEQSIVHERLAEKELQKEGGNTGEKYVTASYKRMMEENKKFAEEDAAKEAYNQQHAASLEENTSGMYKDLYKQDIFMGGYRPDIATMMKQPQKPAVTTPQPQAQPQTEQQKKPEEIPVQQKPQAQPEPRKPVQEERREPEPRAREIDREERKRERENSREKSREREKSPSRIEAVREEAKAEKAPEKEKEKELTKEEKLKLMKERYMQRKANQSAAPGPGPENA